MSTENRLKGKLVRGARAAQKTLPRTTQRDRRARTRVGGGGGSGIFAHPLELNQHAIIEAICLRIYSQGLDCPVDHLIVQGGDTP
jgi:hypothetical protein